MAVSAKYTEPLNSMVSPEQRDYVDKRADQENISRADVVREALDALRAAKPLDVGAAQ